MNVFITYMILGLSLSAPIGPVNAAQLDKGVKLGFLHAWLVGLGAMVADAIYMLLIYFGLAHFLDTPFLKTFLWLFGCFVLLYTGIESLLNIRSSYASKASSDGSASKSFMSGFLLALTNPLNILFWLGIYGSVLAKTVESHGMQQVFIYSLGIFIGILLWDLIMAAIASTLFKFGSKRIIQSISGLASLSLIGFGLYFGYQAFKAVFG
ncbi:LysE family translocator [Paenibacillus eucommiae]|uniref:Threonine/homoserine/homoserine lactone efflux protein n=1 Tax=Paenibacillus eucommiae TaxID=1355755 RepID=A0ABS4J0L1_9BACL|nr:LysE family translocator [Paenibacillus eucommiae]MBP1993377.1 threonine/homoserine/homoserine lactone efflux protein [Paenibacillus eucommiae]